jgi:L-glyceraldehyde 3-phosphate reductase
MYLASDNRYEKMVFAKCGNSGIKLPLVSLGLWQNFGSVDNLENQRKMLFRAFDLGITHIDLANNYGPVYGSAEDNFGRIMQSDLAAYRDELLISTKAGYDMWPGPYGNWGSRKYLISSLNASLKRMKLDYVDIFYHHRPDPDTPIEETAGALIDIVRQGKALYAGISNYKTEETKKIAAILKANNVPLFIHQLKYSMLVREPETTGLLDYLHESGVGCICFSPLAQGLLTDKYLNGIANNSRATRDFSLKRSTITLELIKKLQDLNAIAQERGQSLAQMALSWVLRNNRVTSVLIGASKVEQIEDNIKIINRTEFTQEELNVIEQILK